MILAWNRITTVLLLLVLFALIAVIGMLSAGARGGTLDPPNAPSSTMKTLDYVDGAWDRRLDTTNGLPGPDPPAGCDSTRFRCVLTYTENNVTTYPAVLDIETGIVWERSPGNSTYQWLAARDSCSNRTIGQRRGWRLPTIEELNTLLDPQNAHLLPQGSPFNVTSDIYWSSTEVRVEGLAMNAIVGGAFHGRAGKTTFSFRAWCVRGGGGENIERASP
jgi:hypothetical protein